MTRQFCILLECQTQYSKLMLLIEKKLKAANSYCDKHALSKDYLIKKINR